MKRLALLKQKLDKAIKAYREHIEAGAPEGDEAAAVAYAEKTAKLKATMDAASQAVQEENEILEAERLLAPTRTAIDRDPYISGGEDLAEQDPKFGFKSKPDFFRAVIEAGMPGGKPDRRLRGSIEAAAPTTSGSEGTGADGGYLVPPEYSREIYQLSLDEGSFLPLTFGLPLDGNSITFPVDETTPWGTDGIRMHWAGELTVATQTKPKLGERTLKLRKLLGLVPLSDELLADARASGAFVTMALGRSLAWKVNDAIINGPGGQQPLGFRSSAVAISITKEAAQAADTIVTENVAKMIGRFLGGGSPRSRFLVNHDAFNQIVTMKLGNQPIWTPPQSGLKEAPMGFLLGRPIVMSQVCQTLGDAGDIQLVDFGQYVTISKGPEQAESMHIFFDYDATAFRLTFRMDGQPWLSAAVSPANGTSTLSPFVQIEARA
ncbi:MAG: phage major capsid protein [Sphingosinicella sp.]|uniref:phage major capsid protein n=1 Tax=Sphingosinicella sp. TaxID=1917971 RepID=UPI004037A970